MHSQTSTPNPSPAQTSSPDQLVKANNNHASTSSQRAHDNRGLAADNASHRHASFSAPRKWQKMRRALCCRLVVHRRRYRHSLMIAC